jgi:hypothetical protein
MECHDGSRILAFIWKRGVESVSKRNDESFGFANTAEYKERDQPRLRMHLQIRNQLARFQTPSEGLDGSTTL